MQEISFKLEVFEGPLDLMLSLIRKHKLDLYDIEILELIRQYMDYIKKAQENDLEVTSEFLEMAARLVHMKSVLLLPSHEDEAKELKEELEGELLEYHTVQLISKELEERYVGDSVYVRGSMEIEKDNTYSLIHSSDVLLRAFLNVIGKQKTRMPPPKSAFKGIVKRRVVSVDSRIVFLLDRLHRFDEINYDELFSIDVEKSENIATFLALLELIRLGRIVMFDEDNLIKLNNKG